VAVEPTPPSPFTPSARSHPGIGGTRAASQSELLTGDSSPLGPLAPVLADLQAAILGWYRIHRRRLAFRETSNPYEVLVAEVMAQQTQVERVDRVWRTFVDRFPTPAALAGAPLADVLRVWRGLGYHRRARDLQRAARQIVDALGGRIPAEPVELAALPGVGPYTARAVAAIAFHRPVVPLDTNSARVLRRLVGKDGAAIVPHRQLQELADATVPPGEARAWAQALMELGSRLCRPRAPDCPVCPAVTFCAARPGLPRGGSASAPASTSGEGVAMAAGRQVARGASSRRAGGTDPRPRRTGLPFPRTRRWLRGRIVDRLREVPADGWLELEGPLGDHPAEAVAAALADLVAEGLVERAADGRRVRLAR
jgi:A/G-specific adenine glycosylase